MSELASEPLGTAGLEQRLRDRVRGEVGFDTGTRATYSTDASNYRQVPIGVVLPSTVDDAEQAVATCRERDVPVLSRGGGTSLLRDSDWRPPTIARRAIAQPHCHQHAVLGFGPDQELLRACGVDVQVLDAGCCGLAGNFGFERGHYEVSMACAEDALLPAVRGTRDGTLVLADGFSCRTQIEHGAPGSRPLHLAELLADGMHDGDEPR